MRANRRFRSRAIGFPIVSSLLVMCMLGCDGCNGWFGPRKADPTATSTDNKSRDSKGGRTGPLTTGGATTVLSVPFSAINKKFTIGQGFQTIRNEPAGMLVQPAALKPSAPGVTGSDTTYNLDIVDSSFELVKDMSASASASFQSLFAQGDAYYQMAHSFRNTKHSLFIEVTVKVKNSPEGIEKYEFTQQGRQDANSMPAARFYETYGDTFVDGLTTGGELIAAVQIVNESSEAKENTRAGISGHVGSFKAAADFETALKEMTAQSETHVKILKRGGFKTLPSLAELIREAESFPKEVASANGKDANGIPQSAGFPIVYSVSLQRFSRIEGWPQKQPIPSTGPALDEIARLADQRVKLLKAQGDIESILETPDYYDHVNTAALGDEDKLITKDINIADTEAAALMANPIGTSIHKVDYAGQLPTLPTLRTLDNVPVLVSARSAGIAGSDGTWDQQKHGALAGSPGKWIDNLGMKIDPAAAGLGIRYSGQFTHIFGHTNVVAADFKGQNGDKVGKSDGGDYYALKSIRISLFGAQKNKYDVFYKILTMGTDGLKQSTEFRNDDVAAAGAPDFSDQLNKYGNYAPVSYISQISVRIAKKP